MPDISDSSENIFDSEDFLSNEILSAFPAEKSVPADQLKKAGEALFARIDRESEEDPIPVERKAPYGQWALVAAVFLAMVAGAWLIFGHNNTYPAFTTSFGQMNRQLLSDGSEVLLNANSRLQIEGSWQEGEDRKVHLDGEAFFHVKRTPEKSHFIVHTEHMYVIVTGTQFNVVNRPGKESVLLKEGSVIVGSCKSNEITLKPGDFVQFQDGRPVKKTVMADSLMAWQEQKLVFDKTPLRDLVTILHDQYGVNVQLKDPSIGDSTISAILPNNNLEVLLEALRATSDFEVVREKDLITIAAHKTGR